MSAAPCWLGAGWAAAGPTGLKSETRRLAKRGRIAYYDEAMSTLTPKSIDRLVLGTVNASYRTELDAGQLARAILIADVDTKLPHLATFFGEV